MYDKSTNEEVGHTSSLKAIMENWNQDHHEMYSNFYGLYIKFHGCGKWPWTW